MRLFIRNVILWFALFAMAPTAYAVDAVKNFTKSTLAQGYNEASTVINLTTGHGARMPSTPPFRLVWWDCTTNETADDDPSREIILVTGQSTDSLTVVRGYEGTAAVAHNTPGKTYCVVQPFTAGMYEDFKALILAGSGGPQDMLNVVAADLNGGLASAIASIGSNQKVLRVSNTQTALINTTFAENMTVWVECSGRLSWTDGLFLDFDRPEQIKAGDCQIFDAKAGVRFAKPGKVNPAWWGARESATSTEGYNAARQAIDAMAVGTSRANILKFSAGIHQLSDLLVTNSRNFTVEGDSEKGTVMLFAATGAGKHGFSCSGVTSYLRVKDITISPASPLALDNAQAGINCDSATATLAADTIVEVERATLDGWNRPIYCDGGNSFLISRCLARHTTLKTSGVNSTSLNYALVCSRVSLCFGEYNVMNGQSKGKHGLFANSATSIWFTKNSLKNFGAEAEVARMQPDDGSHPNPKSWSLEWNDLENNDGSVRIESNNAYDIPLVSLNYTTIVGDSGGGANDSAILINLAGTSKIRTITAHGLQARNVAKRVFTMNGVSGTLLDRVEAFGLGFYNWSTGSATTHPAIDTNSTGTKDNFVYAGSFDGNSNGRSVLGASFETFWTYPPQALQVKDVNTSVVSDYRFKIPIGGSTQRASVGGTHYTKTTATNTAADTTETILDTVTINSKAFNANKNGFKIKMAGSFAANSNTKTLRFKFNGTTILSNDKTTAPNGVNWIMDMDVFYVGNNSQIIDAKLQIDCVNQTPYVGLATGDDDTNLAFLSTGQNGTSSNNDIRHLLTVSQYIP